MQSEDYVMMVCPASYIEAIKDEPFDKLIEERKSLEREIERLETILFSGKTGNENSISPGPDVKYQMDLEYLAELCKFMKEKYNQEIVFGKQKESLTLKDILKEIKSAKGYTNASLAEKCGYATASGISTKLEGADTIRIDTLIKILDAMDCELVIRDKAGDEEWRIGQ